MITILLIAKLLMVGSFFVGCKIGGTWMHTAILTVALMTLTPAAAWESSYSHAKEQAAAQKRPLVIVFAPGSASWTKVVQTERPAPAVEKLLSDKFVCLYVDTTTADGKKFAANYEISGSGIVISDRNLESQAFWHQGDISNDYLVHYLTKYGDPSVVVRTTEQVPTPRNSYYPSYQSYPSYYQSGPVMRSGNC